MFADCANRIGIKKLQEFHPEKCYEVGISEQNAVSMAAAMAHEGFHVFAVAYAPFITARVLDQIRANLAYMKAPVCLIGLGAGMASSDLGATHTAFEDIANMRGVPSILVNTPADTYEIAKSMEFYTNSPIPMYMRITVGNPDASVYTTPVLDYDPFKYDIVKNGDSVAVLVTGSIICNVIKAVELLDNNRAVEIINVRSIKPLDPYLVEHMLNYSEIVTVEEHSIIGGLGSTVAEIIATSHSNSHLTMIGIKDEYFKADIPNIILERIGLSVNSIMKTLKDIL